MSVEAKEQIVCSENEMYETKRKYADDG